MQAAYCFRLLDSVTAIYWYTAVFSLQERCRSISLVTGAPKSVTPKDTHLWNEPGTGIEAQRNLYWKWFLDHPANLLLKAGLVSHLQPSLDKSLRMEMSQPFWATCSCLAKVDFFFPNMTLPCCMWVYYLLFYPWAPLRGVWLCFCNSLSLLNGGWLLPNHALAFSFQAQWFFDFSH